jgi:hypothetical protein
MKPNKKHTVLPSIQSIFEKSQDSELKPDILSNMSKELKIVGAYLGVSAEEALFFSVILSINFSGNIADFKDICSHFKISAIKLVSQLESIDSLAEKGYVVKKNGRNRYSELHTNKLFMVKSQLSKAIIKNQPCPTFVVTQIENTIDAIERLNEFITACLEDDLSIEELENEAGKLLEENGEFTYFKAIKEFDLTFNQTILLYYIVWKTLSGVEGISINPIINAISSSKRESIKFFQSLYSGSNPLISNNLIESRNSGFLNDIEFYLTDKNCQILAKDNIVIPSGNVSKKNSIKAESISAKTLYYNDAENQQLINLHGLLKENKYSELRDRLNAKNLPLSLNVLLFGGPGTGKTESVLQLAKNSGREIIKVDISSTKSKWFGESEKLIKKIFIEYAEYSEKCDLTPILFFNEADAILSKRTTGSDSGTQKTENAIQNILLEELENFEGIFFATTNMAQNLDSAFDRRFLYKIEFTKPELKQRIAIWESKLPNLTTDDYFKLGSQFELSGGQIENIVRKSEISQVLYNTTPSFEAIVSDCLSEKNDQSKSGIGFLRSEKKS